MLYEFEYTVGDSDIFEFNKYHFLNEGGVKQVRATYEGTVPIMALIIIIFVVISNDTDNLISGLIRLGVFYVTISALWIIGVRLYFKFLFRPDSHVKKQLESSKRNNSNPDLYDFDRTVKLQFDEEYMYISSQTGETKSKYSIIKKVGDGSNGIYLYQNATQANNLPNSIFESEEQRNGFLSFIREKSRCTN